MLTCYRLAAPASDAVFDHFVDTEELTSLLKLDASSTGFDARVYYRAPEEKAPPWKEMLRNPFPELGVVDGRSPSALLLVKLAESKSATATDLGAFFAFPFGPGGRFFLNRELIQSGYGLRTALNMIYPKGSDDSSRLRAVDRKRHGSTVVRSRSQASQQADLEMFDINQFRDVLDKATGTPVASMWATTVTGSDAFTLNGDLQFASLGDLCKDLDAAYESADYKTRFGWIDNIRPISDRTLVEKLSDVVLQQFLGGSSDVHLGPPDIVDWDRVGGFRYELMRMDDDEQPVFKDLAAADYRKTLGSAGLGKLTVKAMQRHRVHAIEGSNTVVKWTIWRCLVAEVKFGAKTYLLESGQFFSVDADYLDELNQFVGAIPDSTVALPSTTTGEREDAYNARAARVKSILLLDKKTVRMNSRTTAIEICDLLTDQRELVHVKRHLGSSSLSHLFGQGLVSAELLQSSVEFRKKVTEKVEEQTGGTAFNFFHAGRAFEPREFTVVFAVAAEWAGRDMATALPFFSKVNLREVTTNLSARGFEVRLHCIDAAKVPPAKAPSVKVSKKAAAAKKAAAKKGRK